MTVPVLPTALAGCLLICQRCGDHVRVYGHLPPRYICGACLRPVPRSRFGYGQPRRKAPEVDPATMPWPAGY